MANQKKVIVVGGGLSGVCVAYQLLRLGANVTLFDNGINHSSTIAAGMINPLVFRRMNKSWRADEFIPYIKAFYARLEKETQSSFFHPVVIRRMFSSEQEKELWEQRQFTSEYADYMTVLSEEDHSYTGTINPYGSGRVKNAFYITPSIFLTSLKKIIEKEGTLCAESFEYDELKENNYKKRSFDHIVFCEGSLGKNNPWFGDLPLDQTKGEILTVRSHSLPENESVNRKCFVLPMGEKEFKVGSTYVWNTATTEITPEGRKEILEHLSYLTEENVEVIDQKAGIRPTTKDRRPLIGTHPERKNYHFFNGLGAKGYLLAPLLSEEFCEYLLNETFLSPEVDLKRFSSER